MSEDSEAEAADRSRRISRRSVLLGAGGIGLAAAGFAVGAATGAIKLDPVWQHTINAMGQLPTPTPSTTPPHLTAVAGAGPHQGVGKDTVVPAGLVTTAVAKVHSRTGDADLDLVAFLPGHVAPAKLPVVLMLPGTPGDPRKTTPGLSAALANQAATGGRPFAVVALDGEDGWHQRQAGGTDPMDVLVDELPAWLAAHHLGGPSGVPVAVAGVGMGGFDALLYARRRNERGNPVRVVATIAPGLATSWQQVGSRHAFVDAAQWAQLDPLRHVAALGQAAIGVWSGDRDPYRAGIEQFVKLAHPQFVDLGRPGHGNTTLRATLGSMLRFIGDNLPVVPRG